MLHIEDINYPIKKLFISYKEPYDSEDRPFRICNCGHSIQKLLDNIERLKTSGRAKVEPHIIFEIEKEVQL